MVIRTDRPPDEERLVAALRACFDASVMNFGSYNILFATNSLAAPTGKDVPPPSGIGATEHFLVGYRRRPLELVLCPVDLAETVRRAAGETAQPAALSVPVSVDMTNLAGLASEGTSVEVTLSTGQRVRLSIRHHWDFTGLPGVPLHQRLDVEDFFDFIDYFMDTVDQAESGVQD